MDLAKFTPSLLEKMKMSLASKHAAPSAARAATVTTALSATLANIGHSDIEQLAALEAENPGLKVSDILSMARAATPASATQAAAAPAPKRKTDYLFASEPIEMHCPQCEHVFILDSKEHQSGQWCQCPSCNKAARMTAFAPRNVKVAQPRAASPAASQQMPVAFAAAPAQKRYFQSINGRVIEMNPGLAAYVGKTAILGSEWKEDILGIPADSGIRGSQAMNRAYGENLRRSAIGGGQG